MVSIDIKEKVFPVKVYEDNAPKSLTFYKNLTNNTLLVNSDVLKPEGAVICYPTHLKDAEGTMIYEGDILRLIDGESYVNKAVKFNKEKAAFEVYNSKLVLTEAVKTGVVIGNAFENKDLLEEAPKPTEPPLDEDIFGPDGDTPTTIPEVEGETGKDEIIPPIITQPEGETSGKDPAPDTDKGETESVSPETGDSSEGKKEESSTDSVVTDDTKQETSNTGEGQTSPTTQDLQK